MIIRIICRIASKNWRTNEQNTFLAALSAEQSHPPQIHDPAGLLEAELSGLLDA